MSDDIVAEFKSRAEWASQFLHDIKTLATICVLYAKVPEEEQPVRIRQYIAEMTEPNDESGLHFMADITKYLDSLLMDEMGKRRKRLHLEDAMRDAAEISSANVIDDDSLMAKFKELNDKSRPAIERFNTLWEFSRTIRQIAHRYGFDLADTPRQRRLIISNRPEPRKYGV